MGRGSRRGEVGRIVGAQARRGEAMGSRALKSVLLTLLALVWLAPGPSRATFDPNSKYGKMDYAFSERQLCYPLHAAIGQNKAWAQWTSEAAAAWNQVSAQTGWTFRPCNEGEAADIVIVFVTSDSDSDSAATDFESGGGHAGDYHDDGKSTFCRIGMFEDVSGRNINGVTVGHAVGVDGKGWSKTD